MKASSLKLMARQAPRSGDDASVRPLNNFHVALVEKMGTDSAARNVTENVYRNAARTRIERCMDKKLPMGAFRICKKVRFSQREMPRMSGGK